VADFSSVGFAVSDLGRIRDSRLSCLRLDAGGRIGRHPAVGRQLLLLIDGDASVSGTDGVAVVLRPGQAVIWSPGEQHETRSDTGMLALVLEGAIE
jgi:quercetin dioxygenase-like cupin family protein